MNLHKLIKPLSIGIISLGLLAGIGVVSNNTNIHAMTADQILHDPYADASVQKDTEAMDAYVAKQAKESAKADEEQDREDTFPDDTPSQQPMPVDGNYNVKPTRKHVRHHHYIRNRRNYKRIHLNKKHITRRNKRQSKRNHIKLSRKQYNRLNKQLKKSKKLVKSKRAKHNRRYRNSLKRTIKNITRRLRLTRGNK